MRIVPILTALITAAAVYGLLIEREALLSFVRMQVDQINARWDADDDLDTPAEQAVVTEIASEIESDVPENYVRSDSVRVIAVRTTAKPITSGVIIRGQAEALRVVDVRAQAGGLVIGEPKRKGTFVTYGETICELHPGSSAAELAEAKAMLDEARLNEETATQLAKDGFAPESRIASTRAQLQSAEAAYLRAQEQVYKLTLTAPFDGHLESDAAEVGSLLQPGSLCATIIQLDPIIIAGNISERDVEKIAINDRAEIRFLSDRTAKGVVTFVARSGDPDTRTFRIEVTVNNDDLRIRDGSAAEVFVATDNQMAHLVPQSVLTLNDQGILGVRTVDQDTARFHAVEIIRDSVDGVWISGLPESVDIIVVGHEFVIDGSRVTVVYRDSSA
ncbi:MAG: efflux RND transporter periplasmic adaptor subunit [Rhodobacteraceae bacterium]|nr:efflux RND transporter periplasmic adaptor subunit [Paracoccaceae bacterium]MCY4198110.1 efflux RND transporter periplasmic adaptor subunit [Paracoccaceae bacterium]MCY4327838.1 efflux RND transporter periplasmic adaptor subunit [Paracoccaceae bacterium]